MSQSLVPQGWGPDSTSEDDDAQSLLEALSTEIWFLILEELSPQDWLAVRRSSAHCKAIVDRLLSGRNWLTRRYHALRLPVEDEYEERLPNVAPRGVVLGNPLVRRADPERILDHAIQAAIRIDKMFERLAHLGGVNVAPREDAAQAIQAHPRYQYARAEGLAWLRQRAIKHGPDVLWLIVYVMILYIAWRFVSNDSDLNPAPEFGRARRLL